MNRGDRPNFLAASIWEAVGPAETPAAIAFPHRAYPVLTPSAATAVSSWFPPGAVARVLSQDSWGKKTAARTRASSRSSSRGRRAASSGVRGSPACPHTHSASARMDARARISWSAAGEVAATGNSEPVRGTPPPSAVEGAAVLVLWQSPAPLESLRKTWVSMTRSKTVLAAHLISSAAVAVD